jgi:hypothetical protein
MSVNGYKPPVYKPNSTNNNNQQGAGVQPNIPNVPNYSASAYQGGFPKLKK